MANTRDAKGLRIAYAPDIAGVGVDQEIESLCRTAALRACRCGRNDRGDSPSRSPTAAMPSSRCAARSWWRVFLEDADATNKYGANLKGNIDAGLKLTVRDVTAAERKRAELWHRCRALFERVDLLLTPTAPVPPFPVEQNYPDTIAGRKMATYIDWIAPTFLITLCGLPAASVPCGHGAEACRSGCRSSARALRSRAFLGSPRSCRR